MRPCCPPVGRLSLSREGRAPSQLPHRCEDGKRGRGPDSRDRLEGCTEVPDLPATAWPRSLSPGIGRIQWARSRVRLAGWRRGRAAGCGEPESRARAERGGGWCPYIKAGPATLQGKGGETGRGRRGESSSVTAAPVISTRWFCPPGTGEISRRGRGEEGAGSIIRKCYYSCWGARLLPFSLSGVGGCSGDYSCYWSPN